MSEPCPDCGSPLGDLGTDESEILEGKTLTFTVGHQVRQRCVKCAASFRRRFPRVRSRRASDGPVNLLNCICLFRGRSKNETVAVKEAGKPRLHQDRAHSNRVSTVTQVIVTAQKREERLQDVPVAVTVINPDTFVRQEQVRKSDCCASPPRLNIASCKRSSHFCTAKRPICRGSSLLHSQYSCRLRRAPSSNWCGLTKGRLYAHVLGPGRRVAPSDP